MNRNLKAESGTGSSPDVSNHPNHPRLGLYGILGIAVAVIACAMIAWYASAIDHVANGEQTKTFVINIDFDRFRQIMVRKNGTESIIGYSGMKLIDEQVQNLEIDTSGDDRPLLNAIRGRSKTDVSAVKHLIVQLDDKSLEADKLELRQVAEIEPDKIHVSTTSTEPAGKLEKYNSTLHAKPSGKSTELTVTVGMSVRTKVPKLLVSRADKRVQQAADDAVVNQAEAMTKFFSEHSDERVILPDFDRRK